MSVKHSRKIISATMAQSFREASSGVQRSNSGGCRKRKDKHHQRNAPQAPAVPVVNSHSNQNDSARSSEMRW